MELAKEEAVEVGDEEVKGLGAIEAVVDADKEPSLILGDHHVDVVLPYVAVSPLHTVVTAERPLDEDVGLAGFAGSGLEKGTERNRGHDERLDSCNGAEKDNEVWNAEEYPSGTPPAEAL
ncbi:hypothetical protein E2562_026412 [Oryza meyeriana var. granulata]|uniref:DUF834 domain-containing protein n=1 Tax=Oryza meyeriana var. granulata TaxID=110450 RepID=A0A6G1FCY9_9ORYZ|nr:hypothetical protein E2562_026412 [Oryza meyeriana var. granulata]